MKLGFEESQATYSSEPQNARALTEHWLRSNAYCPNCGHASLSQFPNNKPVADFHCVECGEQYELKSQKGRFGNKIVDGAYKSMIERLNSPDNPNLMLLNYARDTGASNLIVVPKQFFVPAVIEERKPLAITARRAGWIGCNILFRDLPEIGKIFIVRDRKIQPIEQVREQWRRNSFLLRRTHKRARLFCPSSGRFNNVVLGRIRSCADRIGRDSRLAKSLKEIVGSSVLLNDDDDTLKVSDLRRGRHGTQAEKSVRTIETSLAIGQTRPGRK